MKNNVFENLISLKEASNKWKIDDSVLRRAISGGKLKNEYDVKKFGKQWIISEEAMNRVYGRITAQNDKHDYSENKKRQIYYYQSEILFKYSSMTKKSLSDSSSLFTKLNLFKMLYDCYDYLHLGDTNDVVKDIASRIRRNVSYGRQ